MPAATVGIAPAKPRSDVVIPTPERRRGMTESRRQTKVASRTGWTITLIWLRRKLRNVTVVVNAITPKIVPASSQRAACRIPAAVLSSPVSATWSAPASGRLTGHLGQRAADGSKRFGQAVAVGTLALGHLRAAT